MSELSFDGQRTDENVEFIFRRHFSTTKGGVRFLIIMVILGFLPLILWPGDTRMFWIFLGAIVIGLLGFGYACLLWYFSIYIVTNQRIRQITQKGIFKKTVVDLELDRIQSVSISVPGMVASLVGYGTILIQTAVGDLIISQVPKPDDIHNKLQNIAKGASNA